MPRVLDVLTVTVLGLSLACSSDEGRGTGSAAGSAVPQPTGTTPATTTPATPVEKAPAAVAPATPDTAPAAAAGSALEQVQKAAPGMKASPAELKVTGIELFVVSDAKPAPDGTRIADKIVGVVGGAGGKIVEGNELVRAVLAARPDPTTLARVALQVAQYDAEILEAPTTAEQRKAKVRPPRFVGKALVFWVSTLGVPRRVEQGKLDRTTGAFDIAVPPALRAGAITSALVALVDPNIAIDQSAIRMLAGACADPRVKNALLTSLAGHPHLETRAALADVLHHCGPDAIQPLSTAMQQDRALVRSRAATGLGRIGDGRARPALGKATKSDDANLAWAAKNALGKLK
jgi:hypothetical protein